MRIFIVLMLALLYTQSSFAQVMVIAHKGEAGIEELSPISKGTDSLRAKTNKVIISISDVRCSVDDLVSVEWVTNFLTKKLSISNDFEVVMIIPINTNHVVIVGKNNEYGYFEMLIPEREE